MPGRKESEERMKYQVLLYHKGIKVKSFSQEEKSYFQALKSSLKLTGKLWTHARVTGKTTRRYDRKLKIIHATPKFFKQTVNGFPAVLILFGNIPEFHRFAQESERDQYFEELCTQSKSATSAESDLQPNDTTASFEETNVSKSGSTETKTSNGFVENVMTVERQTPLPIAESFTKSKSKDSEKDGWNYGYAPAPSKSKGSTLKATVKPVEFGITSEEGLGFNKPMLAFIGKTLRFRACSDHWTAKGWCFSPEWLFPVSDPKVSTPKKNKEDWAIFLGASDSECYRIFVNPDDLKPFIGKKVAIHRYSEGKVYAMFGSVQYIVPIKWFKPPINLTWAALPIAV
jgi:hypothetical protein